MQNNIIADNPIKFKHIKVEDGLSQSWVKTIHQDRQGFIWFGTEDGLNKFDGYSVTNYYSDDASNLTNNSIHKIFNDTKGNLWIGTARGLNHYDSEIDEFVHKKNWPTGLVSDILELEDNKYLIATSGQGLLLFNPDSGIIKSFLPGTINTEKFTGKNPTKGFNSYVLHSILRDRNGKIWIGTSRGLSTFDPITEEINTYRNKKDDIHSIGDDNIITLYEDSSGRIWIGTYNNGLDLLKNDSQTEELQFTRFKHNPNIKNSISAGTIITLCEDNSGYLWIGTENGGLDRLNLNALENNKILFEHQLFDPFDDNGISSNSISSLFKDRSGGIWVGTHSDGVSYYNPLQMFTHIKRLSNNPNGLNDKFINCFWDEKDKLWIGTEKGVNLFHKKTGTYKHYIHDPNNKTTIGSNAVQTIFRDSKDNLWFGTWGGGLNLFNEDTETFIRYKHNEDDSKSISNNNVSAIIEDKKGSLWISTMGGGLNKFDYQNGEFKNGGISSFNGSRINNSWVMTILEDYEGNIWISNAGAIDVYNPVTKNFKSFKFDKNDPKSINNYDAIIFFEDSKNNLWIGTNHGLLFYNKQNNNFDSYKMNDGLPSNQIKGILEDEQGHLWLSTNKGITKFINGSNKTKNKSFINYTVEDGLQGNEFKSGSCLKCIDGKMYFGGNNGFNVFYPDSIKDIENVPATIFSDFLIGNKIVEIGELDSPLPKHISYLDEIVLNHTQSSVFSIEYGLLNFSSPHKNQYAFMLEGFENDWNFVGNQRLATYTNLDAGEYTFHVKGAIGEIWNQQITSIHIIIIPPWWKTVWAYLLYSIFIGFILYTIWKSQLKKRAMKHELFLEKQHAEKLEELNNIKSRFFANITHEFRSPLTLIMGPMKQILNGVNKEEIKEVAKLVLRNSERLYQLINQILDLAKIEAGSIKLKVKKTDIISLIDKIVLSFAYMAERRKIEIKFIVDDSFNESPQLDEFYSDEDKIYKVISNLLSNALKFTHEYGKIVVTVKKMSNKADSDKLEFTNGYIEISVKDNGIGIDDKDLDKIFNRFYQAADPRSGDFESTGIGLALTKELVELHSGKISVCSVKDNGSVFYIQLPLGTAHLSESDIYIESSSNNTENEFNIQENNNEIISRNIEKVDNIKIKEQTTTILIVDDKSDIRDYIELNIKDEYKVLKAKNGKDALEIAIKQVPDLIVSDVNMPKMNGIELCSKIKQDELTSHIPVILLTVEAGDEAKIEGFDTGADHYLTKPFEINELKARIRNLIEQRKKLKKKFKAKVGIKAENEISKSVDERFVNKILSILEKNISDSNFGVEELAEELALSRVQVYRKIRAITGKTAVEFIRTVRLNYAAELLKQKHDNIGQIGYKVGFSNPSYFSNSFHKQFGVYPTEYIKQYNSEN